MERLHSRIAGISLVSISLLVVSSVALASPQSQQWHFVTPMPLPRTDHAASYFPELGELVIAGGRVPFGQGDPSAIAGLELGAQTWTPLNPSPASGDVQATKLADGRWVLFDEGLCNTYDPLADTWTSEPALTDTWRAAATISTLPNDDVLVVGGFSDFLTFQDSLRYDPSGQLIVAKPKLNQGRAAHTATLLPGGAVLVAGGWRWSLIGDIEVQEPITSAEIYDPTINLWSTVAPMSTGRERHAGALLSDGRVLVAGGLTLQFEGDFPGTAPTATVELYDAASDLWIAVAPMNEARYGHTMTVLDSGRVIVTGGMSDSFGVLASAEAYDPATDTWTWLPSMSAPRLNATATLVPEYGLVVAGGSTGASVKTAVADVELYPLGQLDNGSKCFIGDDCVSGVCTIAGVCAGNRRF